MKELSIPVLSKELVAKANSVGLKLQSDADRHMSKNLATGQVGFSVGAMANTCLLGGYSIDDTLETCLHFNPGAKTTKSCVYYYRTEIRRKGFVLADNKEAKFIPHETSWKYKDERPFNEEVKEDDLVLRIVELEAKVKELEKLQHRVIQLEEQVEKLTPTKSLFDKLFH